MNGTVRRNMHAPLSAHIIWMNCIRAMGGRAQTVCVRWREIKDDIYTLNAIYDTKMESLETQIYRWRCPMIWQYYLKRNLSRDRLLLLASEPLHHGSVRMQQDVVQSHTFGCRKSSFICHSLSLALSTSLRALLVARVYARELKCVSTIADEWFALPADRATYGTMTRAERINHISF